MDTNRRIVYKDEEIAAQAVKDGISKKGDVVGVPKHLQATAQKVLDGRDSVHLRKNSISPLVQFAQKHQNAKKKKKKRNRASGKSRRKNRR